MKKNIIGILIACVVGVVGCKQEVDIPGSTLALNPNKALQLPENQASVGLRV